jgi:hypothetical protein
MYLYWESLEQIYIGYYLQQVMIKKTCIVNTEEELLSL